MSIEELERLEGGRRRRRRLNDIPMFTHLFGVHVLLFFQENPNANPNAKANVSTDDSTKTCKYISSLAGVIYSMHTHMHTYTIWVSSAHARHQAPMLDCDMNQYSHSNAII